MKRPIAPAPLPPHTAHIQTALLDWYRSGHRDLPWRRTQDPYAVWISEIMLQQTRVETVKERFVQFTTRFPTVAALAAAPLEDVLVLWSGLGYYARARNLHAAAREVVTRYNGRVPDDLEAVRALPGIGPYTAGAIVSIAFGKRAAILDGNVIRVLSRLYALAQSPDENSQARRRYWSLSEALLPTAEFDQKSNVTGDFNQALMELGATVCLPQRPLCLMCPLSQVCQARQKGSPERYPPRKPSRAVPVVHNVTLLPMRHNDSGVEVLLLRRPISGLWGGLWEPPTLSLLHNEDSAAGLLRLAQERLGLAKTAGAWLRRARPLPPFVHVLTHREMRFAPYVVNVPSRMLKTPSTSWYEDGRWIALGQPLALGLASWVSMLLAQVAAPGPNLSVD